MGAVHVTDLLTSHRCTDASTWLSHVSREENVSHSLKKIITISWILFSTWVFNAFLNRTQVITCFYVFETNFTTPAVLLELAEAQHWKTFSKTNQYIYWNIKKIHADTTRPDFRFYRPQINYRFPNKTTANNHGSPLRPLRYLDIIMSHDTKICRFTFHENKYSILHGLELAECVCI
jgi:hypothetical protein